MRLRSAVALIVAVLGACTTFGSETEPKDGGVAGDAGSEGAASSDAADASTCRSTCMGREPCRSFTFDGPTCPPELDSNPATPGVRCDGMLRVFADNTLDQSATIGATPLLPARAHVAFVATINDWIGPSANSNRRLADIASGSTLATIRASTRSGKVELELCTAANVCTAVPRKIERKQPFVVELVAEPTGGVRLLIDCVEAARADSATGAVVDVELRVTFGAVDGQPIDGAFDDLTIWFERLQ